MMTINKIMLLLSWLFLWGGTCLFAENGDLKQELVQKLESSRHDTIRLQTLCDLVDISKPEPVVRKGYVDELLKEAEFQKNNLYKCRAYLYHIYICFNENNREALQGWLKLLTDIAQKEKYYDLMFQGKQCDIDLLVLNEAFEELENEAMAMLRQAESLNNKRGVVMAYQSMARAYRMTGRMQQAADILKKAYIQSLEFEDYVFTADISNSLIAVYKETKNYPELLKNIQERDKMLQNELKKEPEMVQSYKMELFYVYISYAEYYLAVNDLQNTKKYLRLTDKYYSGRYFINKVRYLELNKSYFVAMEEWNKAIASIDSLLPIYQKVEYSYYNNSLLDKATLLSELGDYAQALPLYESALIANDSILVSIYNKQVNYIKNAHATEKMQLQTLRFRSYISLSVLILVVVIMVVLLCFYALKYRINRELRRSERQVRQIAQEVEKVNKVKASFISNMNTAIREPLTEVVDCSLALASDEEFTGEQKKRATDVISKTATELCQLINDILDLSRLEAGMMKFQVANLSFTSYFAEAVGVVPTKKEFKVVRKIEPYVNYQISYDGNWLYRLLRSVFVPIEENEKPFSIEIEADRDKNEIKLTAYNSVLTTSDPSQNIVIQTEMNRMLVEYFGGTWMVTPKYVQFTIPLVPNAK